MSKASTPTAPHIIDVRDLPANTILSGFAGVPVISADRLDALFGYDEISSLSDRFNNAVYHYIGMATNTGEICEDNIEVLTNLMCWLSGIVGDALRYVKTSTDKDKTIKTTIK